MGLIAKKVGKMIGEPAVQILSDISLEIKTGEFVALTGRSGSGKSTLLYILSSLDSVSQGVVEVEGQNITTLSPQELAQFRNLKIGFVFQFHYLISELSALENVLLPAKKTKQESERKEYAEFLLSEFGLIDKMHRLPRQLSGGEQQRVAIARAVVMKPQYLFADEPTGSLDSVNSEIVMKIIRESNEKFGTTVVMVTHDVDFANQARRQIHLRDGKVVDLTSESQPSR
jgi:ABC-type lipoprotein export system ATPase subunit